MPQSIIIANSISKTFGKTQALKNVSISVDEGTVYGLLGPNGAGKTTLVRILATLLPPTSGNATIAGIDVFRYPDKIRNIIGLAGQFAAVDDFLTGRETLEMVGSLYHLPRKEIKKRANILLERLDLVDAANRVAKTYSGGMRRRLDIGASLIGEPKILFLDEPTTGLDPRTRLELWDIIKNLVKNGTTILLTTQYLEEADALASYISVIDHGRVVAKGTSAELKASLGRDIIEVKLSKSDQEKGEALLSKFSGEKLVIDEFTQHIQVHAKKGSQTLMEVSKLLIDNRIKATEIALHRPSLDDVFLAVTGKKTSQEK